MCWMSILYSYIAIYMFITAGELWWHPGRNMWVIPPLHRRWNGGILDSPRCLSVRPSVNKGSPELFEKTIGPIHFIPGIYPYGVSLLTPIHFVFLASFSALWWQIFGRKWGFRNFLKKLLAQFISYLAFTLMEWVSWPLYIFVFLASFRPSGGQIFGRKWGFRNFLKKLLAQFISYLAFTLMEWVSWPLYIFVFLASFSALWWPNIWPKMGFPELFEKTTGSIHFIPGIYPYGVSLLTPIHFGVPSLIFGPLVAKYFAKNGVSGTFWKKHWLNSFFP